MGNDTEKPAAMAGFDEWEYNVMMSALTQYRSFELMLLKSDTRRERQRKQFLRDKADSVKRKLRGMWHG